MYQQLSSRGKTLFWIITLLLWAMLFAPIVISSQTLFPFQVGKAIYYRIFIEIILFFYFWLIMLEPSARPKKSLLLWALVAYFAVLLLSTLFSIHPYRSFWGDIERMEGVFGILHGGALFVIVYSIFKRKEDWIRFFSVSLAISFWVVIYALRQKYGSGVFEAGSIQPGSTLGNPAFAATYSIFHIFFGLIIAVWGRSIYGRIFGVVGALLNLWLLVLTAIRGGQVGFLSALFIIFILYIIYGARSFKTRMAGVGAIVILIALPFLIFALRDSALIKRFPLAVQRLASISLVDDPTLNTRLISLGISWDAFKEKPLLGFGPEHFRVGYNKHFNPQHLTFEQAWFDRAHNKISDVAVMTGGLGLLTYFGMFGVGAWLLLLFVRRSPNYEDRIVGMFTIGMGVAYFVQNIFLFDMPMSYMLFFGSLGFAGYLIDNHNNSNGGMSRNGAVAYGSVAFRAGHYALLLGFAALVVFLIVGGNIKPYRSAYWGRQGLGLAQLQTGTPEDHARAATQGLEGYKKALAIGGYPASEVLRVMTDSILNSGGARREEWNNFFAYTTQEMEKFLAQEPLDPRQFIRLGKLYNEHSFLEPQYLLDAERNLLKAIELVPKRPDAYYELGVAYLQMGQNEKGLQLFRDAVALNERNARAHWTLGIALQIVGSKDEGLASLERAIALGYGWQNPQDINNLSVIYNSLDRQDKLLEVYKVAVERFPTNVQYRINLANLYKDFGDIIQAREHALKAAELDSSLEAAVESFIQELEK